MKKIALILVTLSLLACGGSKTVRTSKKVIKGDWTLSSITYSKSGTYNVTLLNDENKECFENSTWKFIPNNNTGIYSINGVGCSSGDRNFIFTIQEVDELTGLYDFLLKPTDSRGKSVTNTGFRLTLAALSDTVMTWEQTLSVEGEPFVISMNFSKL
ncbi:lipocalin family protein [Tamlana sp. 2201CG12-4]|uniref:lipocalin family protein n=1 Tax=Tamlana sp. 2201CG12-4 TaxID=3112582 RepID=UPI002DBFADFF|nr:lipocalin family protein [Tamlana sp. 2201CG12-4]MEC3906403.1 lipocalin family protein [Tamlana sp. 2201CG12-4]